jgi:hypothetical protein
MQGSLRGSVEKELNRHLASNSVLQQERYGFWERTRRGLLDWAAAPRSLPIYVLLAATVAALEALDGSVCSRLSCPLDLPAALRYSTAHRDILRAIGSFLITAQVGLLGVLSISVSLVTLIAQRQSATAAVRAYYLETQAGPLASSSLALLLVLCFQTLWPLEVFAHRLAGDQLTGEIFLTGVHLSWLSLNILAFVHFITVSLSFGQSERRRGFLRRYLANTVLPESLLQTLLANRLDRLSVQLAPRADMTVPEVEIAVRRVQAELLAVETGFRRPHEFWDLQLDLLAWVIRSWRRRASTRPLQTQFGLTSSDSTLLLRLGFDDSLVGRTAWAFTEGAPLSRIEKIALRLAVRFRPRLARQEDVERATAATILAELAQTAQVAAKDGSAGPFRTALRDLTAFCRFILEAHEVRLPSGGAASYGRLQEGWGPLNTGWTQAFPDVFDAAASTIPAGEGIYEAAAYAPYQLVVQAVALSPESVATLLRLPETLIYRTGRWFVRTAAAGSVTDAEGALELPPALQGDYAVALSGFVGGFEALRYSAPHLSQNEGASPDEQWVRYRATWQYLSRTLAAAAFAYAVAVNNRDRLGSANLRDMLLRWTDTLDASLPGQLHLSGLSSITPAILAVSWEVAERRYRDETRHAFGSVTPAALFKLALLSAHAHVKMLVGATILRWWCPSGPDFPLGEVRRLMHSVVLEERSVSYAPRLSPAFWMAFSDLLAMETLQAEPAGAGYQGFLDALAGEIARAAEPRRISGRVYSGGLVVDWNGLWPELAILADAAGDAGDPAAFVRELRVWIERRDAQGQDAVLRVLRARADSLQHLTANWPPHSAEVSRRLRELTAAQPPSALVSTAEAIATIIDEVRRARILAASPGVGPIATIRFAAERRLREPSVQNHPFHACQIEVDRRLAGPPAIVADVSISKASLLDPPLDDTSPQTLEGVGRSLAETSYRSVLARLWQRPRRAVPVSFHIADPAFWRLIQDNAQALGGAVLILGDADYRTFSSQLFWRAEGPAVQGLVRRPSRNQPARESIWLDEIELYSVHDVPAGTAVLVRADALRGIRYGCSDDDRIGDLQFTPTASGDRGFLTLHVTRMFDWLDEAPLEFNYPPSPAAPSTEA